MTEKGKPSTHVCELSRHTLWSHDVVREELSAADAPREALGRRSMRKGPEMTATWT